MLSVAHLQAGYGPAQVLFDVSFAVGAGEVVTLIGRNGMGKTTTILTVMGLLPPTGGTVTFDEAALADHVRARRAQKRGGAWDKVSLDEAAMPAQSEEVDMIALHDALEQLALVDARKHRVVELRYFGGLTIDETADVMAISTTTVESEWRLARAWLAVRLKG